MPKHKRNSRKKLIIGFLVALLILVVIGVVGLKLMNQFPGETKKGSDAAVCSDDLIKKASVMVQVSRNETDAAASQIRATPGYDHDPNCLYALVSYDMMIRDKNAAVDDTAVLSRIRSNGVPLKAELGITQSSIDDYNDLIKTYDFNAADQGRGEG